MPDPIKKKKNKSFGVLKSDSNKPKDKPLVGPKPLDEMKVKKIKDKINRLEESFKREERILRDRGLGTFSQSMHYYSKEAEKLNKELIKLTGKGSPQFEFKIKK